MREAETISKEMPTINQPAKRQGRLSIRRDFDGHLVSGAAHAARLHFEARLGVVHRALEDIQRIGAGVGLGKLVERAPPATNHGAFLVPENRCKPPTTNR